MCFTQQSRVEYQWQIRIKENALSLSLHTQTHTPYKQLDVDNSRCYFLHYVSDEVELVARAAGMSQGSTYTDMKNPLH